MKKIKVVVKKKFMDRYTGKIHEAGEKLEVTAERFRELNRSGEHVAIVQPEPAPKK